MARDRDLTVDAAEVRAVAEEAVSCLKQAQAIRSTLTGIKTSSDKARTGLDEMVGSVQAKLERIDSLVAEAPAEDDLIVPALRSGKQQIVLSARPLRTDDQLARLDRRGARLDDVVAGLQLELNGCRSRRRGSPACEPVFGPSKLSWTSSSD